MVETRTYFNDNSPHYGRLESVKDRSGVTTTYQYDVMDRVVKTTTSGGSIDAGGASHTVPAREVVTVYDGNNREVRITVNGVTQQIRRYDLAGRLIAELNGDGDGFLYDFYSEKANRMTIKSAVWGTGDWDTQLHVATDITNLLFIDLESPRTETTTLYRDGSVHIRGGTAVVAEERSIIIGNEGGTYPGTAIIEETRTGPNSGDRILTRIGRDMLGRPTFTEQSSFEGEGRKRGQSTQIHKEDLTGFAGGFV